MNYIDLVILAGGKGSRIKNVNKNKPKPLANIGRYSFLDLLLGNLCKYHFRKIFILAGYKGKQIYKKYHNENINFINIECLIEKKPLGTGGGLKKIKNKLSNNFFVINGDTIADFNFYEMLKFKKKNNCVIAITKSKFAVNGNKIRNLQIDQKKMIKINNSKKVKNYKSAGVCLFDKKIFNKIKLEKFSLEDEIIYKLIKNKKIYGYKKKFFFYDIGTLKDFKSAKKSLFKKIKKPAIFLDRDNTINQDKGYTYKYNDFKFINNSLNALKYLSKKRVWIFIVTNQAGIAKGYFTENDFISLHLKLKKKLFNQNIFIDEVKYCPYHPLATISKYRRNSSLRKPNNLMIKQILKKWPIDKMRSIMIGDQIKDYKCAHRSKIKFQYVKKDMLKQIKNYF